MKIVNRKEFESATQGWDSMVRVNYQNHMLVKVYSGNKVLGLMKAKHNFKPRTKKELESGLVLIVN